MDPVAPLAAAEMMNRRKWRSVAAHRKLHQTAVARRFDEDLTRPVVNARRCVGRVQEQIKDDLLQLDVNTFSQATHHGPDRCVNRFEKHRTLCVHKLH
jgi:hypothetical protein